MSTIGQHISNIRSLINQHSRTQESFTDQFLYELLKSARARLLRNLAKQFNHISEWNWDTYTIELEESDPPNWECVPTYLKYKCKVKKSKYKIPEAIKNRNKSLMIFTTLGGQNIDLYSEDEQSLYKDDSIRGSNIMASIVNDYLYVWNKPDLKFIKVSMVSADPMQWAFIPDCTGTLDQCFDAKTSDFSLDGDMQDDAYMLVLEKLKIVLQVPQDITNDSNVQIKI